MTSQYTRSSASSTSHLVEEYCKSHPDDPDLQDLHNPRFRGIFFKGKPNVANIKVIPLKGQSRENQRGL